jgi:hypothetical protein
MTTAREYAALLAAYETAHAGAEAAASRADGGGHQRAGARALEAFEAVVRARPADPASMARQIRFWISDDPRNHGERMLAAIAERLEAMG